MEGPYREGKPLSAIIPPDRRRQKVLAIVAVSMLAGAAMVHLAHGPATPSESLTPSTVPVSATTPLSQEQVARVVASHQVALKEECWDRHREVASPAQLTMNIDVGPDGQVILAQAEVGDSDQLSPCIGAAVRQWRFPAHNQATVRLRVPFKFVRQEP